VANSGCVSLQQYGWLDGHTQGGGGCDGGRGGGNGGDGGGGDGDGGGEGDGGGDGAGGGADGDGDNEAAKATHGMGGLFAGMPSQFNECVHVPVHVLPLKLPESWAA